MVSRVIKGKYKKGHIEPVEPLLLDEDEEVSIIVPKSRKSREAFLKSAGTWKDLVSEEFIEHIHKRRETRRSPVSL